MNEKISIVYSAMLHTLNSIKSGISEDNNLSICTQYSIKDTSDGPLYIEAKSALIEIMKQWPKYSGHVLYPIPDPNKVMSPEGIFTSACHNQFMWKGEYGNLRRELLDFCIETCKQKLKREELA